MATKKPTEKPEKKVSVNTPIIEHIRDTHFNLMKADVADALSMGRTAFRNSTERTAVMNSRITLQAIRDLVRYHNM